MKPYRIHKIIQNVQLHWTTRTLRTKSKHCDQQFNQYQLNEQPAIYHLNSTQT